MDCRVLYRSRATRRYRFPPVLNVWI